MILEAFSKYLQSSDPERSAVNVLVQWLWERLSMPAQNNVDRVIKHEIGIERDETKKAEELAPFAESGEAARYTFVALSSSGSRLLNSLYEYAMSYEQQKWSRWVHCVKASDFKLSRRD